MPQGQGLQKLLAMKDTAGAPTGDTLTRARILAIRKETGMSQEAFGKVIGVSVSAVCAWEKGRSAPRLVSMRKLLALVGPSGS